MSVPLSIVLKVLRKALNHTVLVKLKDGSEYIGVLESFDHTMNLILKDAKEVKSGNVDDPIAKYGTVMVRGSNILYVVVDFDYSSLRI